MDSILDGGVNLVAVQLKLNACEHGDDTANENGLSVQKAKRSALRHAMQLISHSSTERIAWDLFLAVLTVLVVLFIPVKMGFDWKVLTHHAWAYNTDTCAPHTFTRHLAAAAAAAAPPPRRRIIRPSVASTPQRPLHTSPPPTPPPVEWQSANCREDHRWVRDGKHCHPHHHAHPYSLPCPPDRHLTGPLALALTCGP